MIPKPIWIVLGVVAALGLLSGSSKGLTAWEQSRLADESGRVCSRQTRRLPPSASVKKARRLKQQRIEALGSANAARVRSAQAAVKQVVASEAARTGWLGDVDFTADLKESSTAFRRRMPCGKSQTSCPRWTKPPPMIERSSRRQRPPRPIWSAPRSSAST